MSYNYLEGTVYKCFIQIYNNAFLLVTIPQWGQEVLYLFKLKHSNKIYIFLKAIYIIMKMYIHENSGKIVEKCNYALHTNRPCKERRSSLIKFLRKRLLNSRSLID